jgi:hypothetical protein
MERKNPYPLGKTAAADELTHLQGYRAYFNDHDLDTVGAKASLSAHTIEAVWVKNGTSAALLPGEMATWATSANALVGKQVGAKAAAGSEAAGVVDPYVGSAGVADGRHFWLIVKGPVDVIHAGNDTIVRGDGLVVAASGRADKYDDGTTAAEISSRFGRAIDTPANNNAGTKFRALVDFRY